jgi:excisionase family DNA binding protein
VKTNAPGIPPAFLTVRELAMRWKSSERHIWRMIADGRLRVHRIGRLVRIALADVVLFEVTSRPAA